MASVFADYILELDKTDNTKPGAIALGGSDLSSEVGTVQLTWTAPGDDGVGGRPVNLYELRDATSPLTADNFDANALVPLRKPKNAGQAESVKISNLVPGIFYYFAIRSYDEHNNQSNLSNLRPILIPDQILPVYRDDFSDPSLPWWQAHQAYVVSPYEELRNSSSSGGWRYLAVFDTAAYNTDAKYVETGFTWSKQHSDPDGVNAGGVAMLLDSPSQFASGYLVKLRNKDLELWNIEGGAIPSGSQRIGVGYTSASASPGDSIKVRFSKNSESGYLFDYFLNDTWIGSVNDSQMRHGQNDRLYSGVMLYGGMNNDIDNFWVRIPPLSPHEMRIVSTRPPMKSLAGRPVIRPIRS